jgi:DNA-directed RNA polymerase specialized sigma24 family protein
MSVRARKSRHKRNGKGVRLAQTPAAPRNGKRLKKDLELVRRCLDGDFSGWQEMFDHCQPQLLATVRSLSKSDGGNTNLAEEIASRVWFSLVNMNGSLLERFDAHRGCRLTTFCNALARHELLKYWRSERRRENREETVARQRPNHRPSGSDESQMIWIEFVDTLTEREREFLEKVLLVPPDEPRQENLSPVNLWQLRSRVLSKLKQYSTNGKS